MKPSKKIGHARYKAGSHPTRRRKLGCDKAFAIVNHKGHARVALVDSLEWAYYTRHMLSPSEVRALIGWLAEYINDVDPTPLSESISSTKAHANAIRREQDNIAQELGR